MISILKAFWRMCIFKSGPEAIPASGTLVGTLVGAHLVFLTLVQAPLAQERLGLLAAITMGVVSLASTTGLVWIILHVFGHPNRFTQTITAILGVDLLLTTLVIILSVILTPVSANLAGSISLAILMWVLAAYGFIFHRALNIHIGFGIAIAIFVVLFTIAISQTAVT